MIRKTTLIALAFSLAATLLNSHTIARASGPGNDGNCLTGTNLPCNEGPGNGGGYLADEPSAPADGPGLGGGY